MGIQINSVHSSLYYTLSNDKEYNTQLPKNNCSSQNRKGTYSSMLYNNIICLGLLAEKARLSLVKTLSVSLMVVIITIATQSSRPVPILATSLILEFERALSNYI